MKLRRWTSITREGWQYLVIFALVFGGALVNDVNLLLILGSMLAGPLLAEPPFGLVHAPRPGGREAPAAGGLCGRLAGGPPGDLEYAAESGKLDPGSRRTDSPARRADGKPNAMDW